MNYLIQEMVSEAGHQVLDKEKRREKKRRGVLTSGDILFGGRERQRRRESTLAQDTNLGALHM